MAEEDRSYDYRLTKSDGDVRLDLGDELAELSERVGVTAITRIVGEGLIAIGTRLMASTAYGDDQPETD